MIKKNILLLCIVVVLAIIPMIFNKGAEFSGADGQAEEFIGEIAPSYEPWFESIWEPPSGEIESLLFALQAALGAGFIAYFFGYFIGKRKGRSSGSQA
jgi:cobalt/nickel transport protein